MALMPAVTSIGPVDHLCILDFEATCHQGEKPWPQEIIEFPTVLLNVSTGQVVEPEFHLYIRPDVHPNLSDFCSELTDVTFSTIDEKGVSLFEALDQHRQWLASHELIPWYLSGGCNGDNNDSNHQTFLYVTCSDWDLKHCLPTVIFGELVPRNVQFLGGGTILPYTKKVIIM